MQKIDEMIKFTGTARNSFRLCKFLFDYLIHINYDTQNHHSHCTKPALLSQADEHVIAYIGGSILHRLQSKFQQYVQHMTLSTSEAECDLQSENHLEMVNALDRGGLHRPTHAAQGVFRNLETIFREVAANPSHKKCTKHDFASICQNDLDFMNTYHGMMYDLDSEDQEKEAFLAEMTKKYFIIRIHHECKLFMERCQAKISKKGLRQSLK